jgi:predicted DNA-binding protein with PD1-like motif
MTYSFDGYNYLIRLELGERLAEHMHKFFAETKIDGGWISGLGAATEVMLGFYSLEAKEYQWKTFSQDLEVTALQGNIARGEDDKVMFHLHGTFSGKDYQSISGHIKDLAVGGTLELFIHRSHQPLQRKRDDATGLQLLDLTGK